MTSHDPVKELSYDSMNLSTLIITLPSLWVIGPKVKEHSYLSFNYDMTSKTRVVCGWDT